MSKSINGIEDLYFETGFFENIPSITSFNVLPTKYNNLATKEYIDESIANIDLMTGITGATGEKGSTGERGFTGANGANGESFIWKGTYSNNVDYNVNDAVLNNGSSYICVTNKNANSGTFLDFFSLMAEKGEKGDKGDKGNDGDKGADGASTIAAIAAAAAAAGSAGAAAGAATAAAISASEAAAAAAVSATNYEARIESLESKTYFQSSKQLENKTDFNSDVRIRDEDMYAVGFARTTIELNRNGNITCDGNFSGKNINTNTSTVNLGTLASTTQITIGNEDNTFAPCDIYLKGIIHMNSQSVINTKSGGLKQFNGFTDEVLTPTPI